MSGNPLLYEFLLEFGIEMADALDRVSAKGILHGDLKPSNISCCDCRHAKILDFAVVKSRGPDRRMGREFFSRLVLPFIFRRVT